MKTILFLLSLLIAFQSAQAECQDTRYKEKIFEDIVVLKDIRYGSNKNNAGEVQDLHYDVYMPEPGADTQTKRPVIVFVHGGSYVGGSKDFPMLRDMCTEFAKRGYVSVSVQYRIEKSSIGLDPIFQFADKSNWYKAIVRSTHDIKAAIRDLKRGYAEEGNPYHIDTNNISLYGSSAGSIGILHTMFLDETDVLNNFWTWAVGDLGGFEGNTNEYYQYGTVNTVRNLILNSGAIADVNWIQGKNDVDVLAFHHNLDPSVPYGHGCFYTAACHLGRFDGMKIYAPYLEGLGTRVESHIINGIGHPADEIVPELVLEKAVAFMYASQCKYDTTEFEIPVPTTVKNNQVAELKLYPNPGKGVFSVSASEWKTGSIIQVHAVTGQLIYEAQLQRAVQEVSFNAPGGMYIVSISDNTGIRATAKLMVSQ